jgi:large subunit ribosomal protein L9
MEVILLQDVETLGEKGTLANVSKGYARNYLLPKGLAEVATPGKIAEFRRSEEERLYHERRLVEQASDIASTLNRTVLTIPAHAGEGERLYGSVTAADVADAIWEARKLRVDKRKVRLDEPIKSLGTYMIDVELAEGVVVAVKTMVVPE